MPQATDSQVAMWKGAIALIWANGVIDEKEKSRLIEFLQDNIYLSDTQRAQLIAGISRKIELKDAWDAITDKLDRAHLIDIAPTLFAVAHDAPTPQEKALYDKMLASQMASIDMQQLHKELDEVKAQIPGEIALIKEEYKHDFDNWGPVGRLIYHLDTMLGGEP